MLSSFHCANIGKDTKHCDHSDEKRIAVLGQHKFDIHKLKSYYTIPIIDVRYPKNQGLFLGSNKNHDLAPMVLKSPAKFTENICPICLPRAGREYGGKSATTVGWGKTYENAFSPVLKHLDLIVSRKVYRRDAIFGTVTFQDYGTLRNKGKMIYNDPCLGDSGVIMNLDFSTSHSKFQEDL